MEYTTENSLSLVTYNDNIANKNQRHFSTNNVGVRIADEFKTK
tara:strand:- start:626 stop:754 length:129 start_codon:yes stop_codon:yes gene_type:complete